jgi:hypothetical protein
VMLYLILADFVSLKYQSQRNYTLLPCRKGLRRRYSCPPTWKRRSDIYLCEHTIHAWHGSQYVRFPFLSRPYLLTSFTSLKWKPPSENSIDFKLILRFPPSRSTTREPDFCAKPLFQLHVWCGDERGIPKYEQYDELFVTDDEWER